MENQRIRLTKRMLKEALAELLADKPIDRITVYELCSRAQINRTTFYKYYGSQFDLMEDMQSDFLKELENSLHEKEQPMSLLSILTYIDTHRASCTALLQSAADNGFLERVIPLNRQTKKEIHRSQVYLNLQGSEIIEPPIIFRQLRRQISA